jgi:beta-alanine--pyruvate transaminase
MSGPPGAIELFHGYTYSAHVLACAAGLATVQLYEDEGLFERAARMAPKLEAAIHSLRGERNVIDIRNQGLVAAVEVAARPGAVGARGFDVFLRCFEDGVLVRQTGDILAVAPALIVEDSEIDRMVSSLRKALAAVE